MHDHTWLFFLTWVLWIRTQAITLGKQVLLRSLSRSVVFNLWVSHDPFGGQTTFSQGRISDTPGLTGGLAQLLSEKTLPKVLCFVPAGFMLGCPRVFSELGDWHISKQSVIVPKISDTFTFIISV